MDIDKNDKFIKLVELSNTWQGEGKDCGRQMLIARFKYCNRTCKFCDTQIKMRTSFEGSYSINDINKALEKTMGIMITGGEPTFHTNMDQTTLMLQYCDYQVANIETNGYEIYTLLTEIKRINRTDVDIKVIYSPKVFTEKDYSEEITKIKDVIDHPMIYLKIVAENNDLVNKFIKEVSERTRNKSKIYLMPLGISSEEIMKNWPHCIDLADDYNLNISTRMHIMNQFV